ncbi:MAG TPA: GNVR domain-containing protein [Pyrinomonadaceae bacterium]|jgi:polysaccharide chain length determinant protein (PEP-CTERM system associated)
MSVEFRQRTPSEYAHILWRRKWLIILPTIAVTVAVAWVVWRLPNVYESTTLLTVRPATISPSVVPFSDSDLTIRINNIGQEVVSRSSLQPLIERFNLYAVERQRGEPMDALVDRMRTRDITVRINTSRNDITNGFNLSFRGSSPEIAKAVTAELATKYVNAQIKASGDVSTQTKEFFDLKLKQAKDELDAIDRQRLEFMTRNMDHLPSTSQALVGQLAGLREQQKTLTTELGRLREQRSLMMTQQGDLQKQREQEISTIAEQVGDPKQSPAYGELMKRRAQLESEQQQLLTQYKPKHPDVIAKGNEIRRVQQQMDEMVDEGKNKVEERRRKLEGLIDPRNNSIKYNLQYANSEIVRLEKQMNTIDGQIANIERRLNGVPGTEVGLEAINREYLTRKAIYDDLLGQQQKASIVADVAANAQGETIAVVDLANLPERPVAPNRPMLMALGFVLGLAFGFAFAALFEVPRLLTIQSTADAEHYTGLPVLVAVPELLTPREERRLRFRRTALAAAGFLVAVASIPALALVLKVTRVFEIFASRG